jgi:hypothetical protein
MNLIPCRVQVSNYLIFTKLDSAPCWEAFMYILIFLAQWFLRRFYKIFLYKDMPKQVSLLYNLTPSPGAMILTI